jgi:hypothetical protein
MPDIFYSLSFIYTQVIRRVAEMKQLVADAESYLHTDTDGGSCSSGSVNGGNGVGGIHTDTESIVSQTISDVSSSNYGGRLRHSDSLLLLTQVR